MLFELTLWRIQHVYGTPHASGPVPLQKWYWLTSQSLYSSPPQHENWEINEGNGKRPLGVKHEAITKQKSAQFKAVPVYPPPTEMSLWQCSRNEVVM